MAVNHNVDELYAILFENLEGIVRSIINGDYVYYEDGDDHIVIIDARSLVFVMIRDVSSCGEPMSITELVDHEEHCTTIPEDETRDNSSQKGDGDVEPFCLAIDTLASGDAPSEKLEHDEATPISEDGPLADVVVDVASNAIEPDKEMAVPNSGERIVGRLDPAVAPGKCDPPRRNRFSAGWKSVKRVFRTLCCCCRPKTIRTSH